MIKYTVESGKTGLFGIFEPDLANWQSPVCRLHTEVEILSGHCDEK